MAHLPYATHSTAPPRKNRFPVPSAVRWDPVGTCQGCHTRLDRNERSPSCSPSSNAVTRSCAIVPNRSTRSTLSTVELHQLIERMRATMEAGLLEWAWPHHRSVRHSSWPFSRTDPNVGATSPKTSARIVSRPLLSFLVLVNPTVSPVEDLGQVSFYEGCLSVPGITGVVARHRAVRVKALDETSRAHRPSVRRLGRPHRPARGRPPRRAPLPRPGRDWSLSTVDNYAQRWAERPPSHRVRCILHFTLRQSWSTGQGHW